MEWNGDSSRLVLLLYVGYPQYLMDREIWSIFFQMFFDAAIWVWLHVDDEIIRRDCYIEFDMFSP